jgi:hypothetical protein
MLAAKRSLNIAGHGVTHSPILIPSLSSRATWRLSVEEQLSIAHKLVGYEILVSAYDVRHFSLSPQYDRFSMVVIDSGGYEANQGHDLSEATADNSVVLPWTLASYKETLRVLRHATPTFIVSYDEPGRFVSFCDQANEAVQLFAEFPQYGSTLLLKPQAPSEIAIDFTALPQAAKLLSNFSVIGVTEKELGTSLLGRMVNLARLRTLLTQYGLDTPIHVFGALDPLTPPLYMVAGADIFDGLTWLRYGYFRGLAVYPLVHFALCGEADRDESETLIDTVTENYLTLGRLQQQMEKFVDSQELASFHDHSELYATVIQQFEQKQKEVFDGW